MLSVWKRDKLLRLRRLYIAIALVLLVPILVACTESSSRTKVVESGDVSPLLFKSRATTKYSRSFDSAVARTAIAVEINTLVLTSPLNSPFLLKLSDAKKFQVIFDQRITGASGDTSVNGYLAQFGPSYRVSLTISESSVFGRILTPEGIVSVTTDSGGVWLLETESAGIKPAGSSSDQKIPGALARQKNSTANKNKIRPSNNHLSMIDVLVLYSAGLESRLSVDALQTRLRSLFNIANNALSDSQVNLRFRMVHNQVVSYPDTNSNDMALNDITTGVGAFQNVNALRDQYSVDLVTFVRDFVNDGSNSCGAAWLNGAGGSALSIEAAYSVVSDGQDGRYFCDDLTLAHELGHSLGSSHEASNSDAIAHFPYAYGYGVPGRFGTVMSYITPQAGRYSNPNISTCLGNVCGIVDTADNARSMNSTRTIVETFRAGIPVINVLPTATTLAATDISESSAVLHATITPGSLITEAFFEYGTSPGNYAQQTPIQSIGADVASQDLIATLSGLQCGIEYFYRAVARNADGTDQGSEQGFTTMPCTTNQPLVTTLPVASVTQTSALLSGTINSLGQDISYYFEYGLTSNFGNPTTPILLNSNSDQAIQEEIFGLSCGTNYQYRLIAEWNGQVVNGLAQSFDTLACDSSVQLDLPVVSNVTESTASLSANLVGTQVGDSAFFEYGPVGSFSSQTSSQVIDTNTSLTDILINLSCETNYSVRVVVKRAAETFRSASVEFVTAACPLVNPGRVVTGAVEGLGQTGVTLVGTLNPTPNSAQIFFEYGVNAIDENRTRSQILSAATDSLAVRQFVSGLSCDTIYQYRIGANSLGEMFYGDAKTFITNPCVVTNALLETLDPEISGATQVTFRARIDPNGIPTVVYFEYGLGDTLDQVTPQYSVGDGNLSRNFSWQLNNLLCGSTYQYRAIAESTPLDGGENIIHAGSILGFVTEACEAVQVDNVSVWATKNSASIDIILNTFGSPTELMLNYGDTEDKSETSRTFSVSSGTVHIQLQQLQCATTYYFSVVASNSNGGIISDQESFATQDCALLPSVVTEPSIGVGATNATLVARVSANGTSTTAYFEYGSGADFNLSTQAEVVGAGFVDQFVSHEISNLSCETSYRYRLVASNEDGIKAGDTLTFTTAACGSISKQTPIAESRLLDANGAFSMVIGPQGSAIAWGDNSNGQLGVDASRDKVFVGIKDETGNTVEGIARISLGKGHVLAITNDGGLLAWGDNNHGQLGRLEQSSIATPGKVSNGAFGELTGIVDIAAGDNHSVAVSNDGSVLTWGENSLGQLGNRSKQDSNLPQLVPEVSTAIKVVAGANHNHILLGDGRVMGWGANGSGQLGDGSHEARLQVVEIVFDTPIEKLFSGKNFTFAMAENGRLWAWGDNQFGQLGLGHRDKTNSPTQVSLQGEVVDVAAGQGHVIALLGDGTALTWGDNSKGQLARPIDNLSASEEPIPVWVDENRPLNNIVAIAAGDFHSVVLTETGNLLAWGDGSKGQLGASRDLSLSAVPVIVSDETGNPVSLKVPRIIVSTDVLNIIEGESAELTVRLSSAPESTVDIQYDLDDTSQFTLSEESRIQFSPTNWDVEQLITITAEADEDNLNDQASLIIKAEGYLDQRVSIVEEDNYPRKRPPRVGQIDFAFICFLLLLSICRRAKVYR